LEETVSNLINHCKMEINICEKLHDYEREREREQAIAEEDGVTFKEEIFLPRAPSVTFRLKSSIQSTSQMMRNLNSISLCREEFINQKF
jgi:hypothetical protein